MAKDTTVVTLRIENPTLKRIDYAAKTAGLSRSALMIEATIAYLSNPKPVVTATVDDAKIQPATRVALERLAEKAVTVASQLPKPARTICPRCYSKLILWEPQMRCENCKTNWPA